MNRKQLLKVGDVAKTLGISPRTVRFYEELGLIAPRRSRRGTRLYTEFDLNRFTAAHRLAKLGIRLDRVVELAKARTRAKTGRDAVRRVRPLLEALRNEVDDIVGRYQALTRDIKNVCFLVDQCRNCKRPPTRKGCPSCPMEKNAGGGPDLISLIWDPDRG